MLYPRDALELVRILVALCVLASWTGLVWLSRRRGARTAAAK
ncbi:hypothetical protein [Nocardia tengchongensis]